MPSGGETASPYVFKLWEGFQFEDHTGDLSDGQRERRLKVMHRVSWRAQGSMFTCHLLLFRRKSLTLVLCLTVLSLTARIDLSELGRPSAGLTRLCWRMPLYVSLLSMMPSGSCRRNVCNGTKINYFTHYSPDRVSFWSSDSGSGKGWRRLSEECLRAVRLANKVIEDAIAADPVLFRISESHISPFTKGWCRWGNTFGPILI